MKVNTQVYLRISELKGDPGSNTARGRLLTYKELVLLLDSCADDINAALGDRDAALLALLASVGLRTNEIVKLNVTDYSPSTKSLHAHGVGSKERQHKVSDTGARRALLAWLKRRGSTPGRFLCPVNKEGKVILKEMSATGIYKAVRLRASKAGVVAFSPTDLRQTFASD
jgi:site-specific recombinase XerD